MKRIILKKGEQTRIEQGHPWVYDNEIAHVLQKNGEIAELEAGEVADVETHDKRYLGRALVNPHSKIRARLFSASKDGLDKGFFKHRIREALDRRRADPASPASFRLVFAEADFLPGLIIDRFCGWDLAALDRAPRPLDFQNLQQNAGDPSSWLAIQFLTYGMDARRDMILSALNEMFDQTAGIIEKSLAKVRELEGLPRQEGLLQGSFPAEGIVVFENGFPFLINLEHGQKTGHFLDQKENRLRTASFVDQDMRVLDMFSYTGGFGIYSARAGANSVTCVDSSAQALEILQKNAVLNGVSEKIIPIKADAFDFLRSLEHKKAQFDLVILDPPAFAKTRSALADALRGYKEINLRAMKLLKRGGVLVSCSCSQAVDESSFQQLLSEAAFDAERRLYRLDYKSQPPDHPILLGYPESFYLKAFFLRVF